MNGRVVVVGSLNLDLVIGLDRMPDSGETVFGHRLEQHAGGKGLNQAVAAARLGVPVSMIGALGDDANGDWLRDVVRGEGIDDAGIATFPGTSGTAVIEVDTSGANRIVVISGANDLVTAEQVSAALEALGDVAVVLTQGEGAHRRGRRGHAHRSRPRRHDDPQSRARTGLPGGAVGARPAIAIPNQHAGAKRPTGLDSSTRIHATQAARDLARRGAGLRGHHPRRQGPGVGARRHLPDPAESSR